MIIRFEINVPQTVRLARLEGRTVESKFGGNQILFMAEEGAFYVSEKAGAILAEQFTKLGVKPGEPVEITRAEIGRGPERRTQWIVTASVPAEDAVLSVPKLPPAAAPEPPSELEQQLAASIRAVEQRKQAQQAPAATQAPAWASFLVTQSNALIDAYAAVLKHSARHEGLVKGDDVRSIFLSAFINVSKSGGRNAA
jgi:hypothetical protein